MRLTFIGLIVLRTLGWGQAVPDTVREKAEDMEGILENVTQDATDSQLADVLAELEENPLDLNSASEGELQQIPGITRVLALRIVSYRQQKIFDSPADLLQIEGISEEMFLRIRGHVTARRFLDNQAASDLQIHLRTRAVNDLYPRTGYTNGAYQGSSVKSYSRMVLKYAEAGAASKASRQGAELGMLFEKDPGERAVNDFMAGYVLFNVPTISSRVIFGDFVVEAGEGLVLWRSVGFSKGSEVISPLQKSGVGIRPYLSTDENLFFRGVAIEWKTPDMSLALFHSNKSLTATVNAEGNITSLFSDGYHRTLGELAGKNNARERLSGFRATLTTLQRIRFGATMYEARFSHDLFLNDAVGHQTSDPTVGGFDISYTDRHMSVYSEIAKTGSGHPAGLAGLILSPDRRVDVAVMFRSYPKDFANVHAYGFREGASLTQNESGVYVGARVTLSRSTKVSVYFDQFRFPWRTSTLPLPATGNDFLLMSEMSLSGTLDIQILYKNRNKPLSLLDKDPLGRQQDLIGERNQRNYRFTLRFSSSSTAEWKSRFEMTKVGYTPQPISEHGYLWMQDMRLRPWRNLTVDTRVIIFETDSFDSRVYEFENDLRGSFSNPALFGKGIRWYMVARHRMGETFEISAKYSRTVKDGVKTLSSGLSEIMGDSEGQFGIQIELFL